MPYADAISEMVARRVRSSARYISTRGVQSEKRVRRMGQRKCFVFGDVAFSGEPAQHKNL